MKNVHYLHVAYQKSTTLGVYYNDSLIIMTDDKNMDWLREELRKDMSRRFNVEFDTVPVITSMTEISEELFNILNQPTFEK